MAGWSGYKKERRKGTYALEILERDRTMLFKGIEEGLFFILTILPSCYFSAP